MTAPNESKRKAAYWMPLGYTARDRAHALFVLGDAVLIRRHEYDRDPASGAGNCWCGRSRESALHPHSFTPALNDPLRCVCSKPPNHQMHAERNNPR